MKIKNTHTPDQNQRKHNKDNNEEERKSTGIPPVNSKPFLQHAQVHWSIMKIPWEYIPWQKMAIKFHELIEGLFILQIQVQKA